MVRKGYEPASPPNLKPGDAVRIARELLEMSQNQLAEKTGISQATISGIESHKIEIGVKRAKILAAALQVHPSVLVFPDWETEKKNYVA